MTPSLPESPARRRNEQIIGVLLAVLGLVVLGVAIVALQHPKGHEATAATSSVASTPAPTTPATTAPTTAPATSATSPAPSTSASSSATSSSPASSTSSASTRLPLIVLNNTNRTGLADTAKARFQAGGWTVTSTGNLVNNIISTCAYYDPNTPGAQDAAAALRAQFPAIKRTAPKFSELPAGPIVVVLTTDYS